MVEKASKGVAGKLFLFLFWFCFVVLAMVALEIRAIVGIFQGSAAWTGVFAILTAINVRAVQWNLMRSQKQWYNFLK